MSKRSDENAGIHESDRVRSTDDRSESDVREDKIKAIEEALNAGTSREIAEVIVDATTKDKR